MDPNATHKAIRDALVTIRAQQYAAGEDPNPTEAELDAYGDLTNAVEALDQWLTNGGFMPAEWNRRGLRVDTVSGIHGQLYAFTQLSPNLRRADGVAIVRRDDPTEERKPYSVHYIAEDPDGRLIAMTGEYDMTYGDACEEYRRRGGAIR